MNKVLRFVLTAVLSTAIICQCALAGPAFPGPYSVDNGNGKTVQIMRYGNQDFVIETDMSGNLVTRDEEGKLRYIVTDDKEGYALSYVVSDTNSRVVSDEAVNRSTSDSDTWSGAISFLKGDNGIATFAEENTFICPPQTENDPLYGKFKDIGKIKKSERGESIPLLVVLVDFNDIKTKRGAKGWSDAIFAAGGLKNYYIENSTGEFSFEPAVFDGQDAPGVVEVTLPIDRPLYATQPDAMNGHVNTGIYKGTDGRDYRLLNDASFYAYAVNAVNEKYSIDFSEYDKNGDGYIDENELCVETIMAGYEASSMGDPEGAPAMWMKRWNIYCGDNGDGTLDYGDFDMVVLDGVGLSPFITCGEVLYLDPEQFGGQKGDILYNQIGGFAHELGHILGANDLYDVTYALANRMNAGYMSIMSGGSWGYNEESPIPGEAPTSLDPLNKFMMGFCEPTEVTTGGAFKLYPSSSRDYNFLEIDTNDPDISYLIENRQFTSFDKSLHDMYESYKNGGISVWRLNNKVAKREWNDNRVNSVAEDYGFIPVFADGVVSRRPFWNTEALDAGNFDNTALPSVGYPSAETHYNMVLQESDPLIALCVDKNTDSDGSVTFQVIMSDATEKPVLEGSGVFIKYDDIYKSADFQLENGGYTENAVWKIYSDVRNSTEAEGITAEYDAQTDKLILKSDTDIPVGEYWASVTEIGLEESLLVKLTVKEAAYELCAEPESLDFGAKYTGYTPKEKTVVLKNTGGLPVENLSASSSSAAFEMTIDKDKLLNYGDTCTLTVKPARGLNAGTYNENIRITGTTDENSCETFVMAGFEVIKYTEEDDSESSGSGGSGGGSSDSQKDKDKTDKTEKTDKTDKTEKTDKDKTAETEKDKPAENIKQVSFADVPSDRWSAEAIGYLAGKGFVSGVGNGKFEPERKISRAEFVAILTGIFKDMDSKEAYTKTGFSDVTEDSWYYNSVMWAVENGIVSGIGNDMFAPDMPVSRQDMAVMIFRAAESMGAELPEINEAADFADSASISDYAKEAVLALNEAGIINGMGDNTFAPLNTTSREQAAVTLAGLIKAIQ